MTYTKMIKPLLGKTVFADRGILLGGRAAGRRWPTAKDFYVVLGPTRPAMGPGRCWASTFHPDAHLFRRMQAANRRPPLKFFPLGYKNGKGHGRLDLDLRFPCLDSVGRSWIGKGPGRTRFKKHRRAKSVY